MSKKPLIPLQVKTRQETREKLKQLAVRNALSINDVANMAIAAGLNLVEMKLREIHEPEKEAA